MTGAASVETMVKAGRDPALPPTTSWTIVKEAAAGKPEARREVFERYRRPVCAYIAARTRDAGRAEEYTTDFFLEKVFKARGRGLLDHADPKRRFRTYLKAAVENFLKDRWRADQRNAQRFTRPDAEDQGWDRIPGEGSAQADDVFQREWTRMILARALEKVRALCERKGQQVHLAVFLGRYAGDDERRPRWAEIGARHGLDERTAQHRAETVQRRFRDAVREVLIEETGSPQAANEELAALLSLSRSAK